MIAVGLGTTITCLAPDFSVFPSSRAAMAQGIAIPPALKKYWPGFTSPKHRHSKRKPNPQTALGEKVDHWSAIPLPKRNPFRQVLRPVAIDDKRQVAHDLHTLKREYQARLAKIEAERQKRRPREDARTVAVPLPERHTRPFPTPSSEPVPLPRRNPRRKSSHFLKQARLKAPVGPASPPPADQTVNKRAAYWQPHEIEQARKLCAHLLAQINAQTTPLPPIRQGACGTPAPIKITAIGRNPQVRIRPAAVLNCQMLPALARFLTRAQSEARKTFGAPIVSIRNASSYVCRHRYNDPKRKLSEHARANALDIPAFILADGRTISVLRDWGPTSRDLEGSASKISENMAQDQAKKLAAHPPRPNDASSLFIEKASIVDKRARFLKTLHRQACQIFGTVLGPEANEAHRDHFHFDLAPRRRRNYCQ